MRPKTISDTIKGFFLGVLITAMMVIGVLLAAPSKADGILTGEEQNFGDRVAGSLCEYLDAAGVDQESIYNSLRIIYQNTPSYMDSTDAADIINYSVYNYCPSHWDELVAFGEGARLYG